MGKAAGMICILLGCLGMVLVWKEQYCRRIRVIQSFLQFLVRWEHCLKREKCALMPFLKAYVGEEAAVTRYFEAICHSMEEKEFPSGSALWRINLQKSKKALYLNDAAYEILLSADLALFGNSIGECIKRAEAVETQLEELLCREQMEMAQKKKVYMPVGMLGGVMLIIFLA